MEGSVIHFRFQTENTRDLLDIDGFVLDEIRKKYVGKCYRGQYITDIISVNSVNSPAKILTTLDKCYMQIDGSFIPKIFMLTAGSILLNCVVQEIKDKGQIAILTFTGTTQDEYKFSCNIMAAITEATVNTIVNIGILTNVQVVGVFYYPSSSTLNVEANIVSEKIPGKFATFDASKIHGDYWMKFCEIQRALNNMTDSQKLELENRSKSMFVDVSKYYLPIKDGKKVSIKSSEDEKMIGALNTPIEKGLGKSQVVYVDLFEPMELTLYIVQEWDSDITKQGLGSHVSDMDTSIGTNDVLLYYIQWIHNIISSVYFNRSES